MADCVLSRAILEIGSILKAASEAGRLTQKLASIKEQEPSAQAGFPYIHLVHTDEEPAKDNSEQTFCAHLTLSIYLDATDRDTAMRSARNLAHDIRMVLSRNLSLRSIVQRSSLGRKITYQLSPHEAPASKLIVKVTFPLSLEYKEEW